MSADPIITDEYKWGFSQPEKYVFKSRKGLDHEIVEQISQLKGEPQWLRDFRHRALDLFFKRPMPNWGGDLSNIDFQDIYYYVKPTTEAGKTWEEVPEDIRDTFEKLGIPEAERKYLAGVGSQYECLSGDTRVYTARGLVPIREIQAGDTVFSFDEEAKCIIPTKVRATAEKGEREVFEVRVGNRKIRATANHPFLTLTYNKDEGRMRGRYTREWKYLSDLAVGDLVAVVKDLPETGTDYLLAQPVIKTEVIGHNQVEGVEYALDITSRYKAITLPEYTSDDLMWWLGLYIGDGYIRHFGDKDKAGVEIAIPDTDIELQAEVIRVSELLFGITPTRQADGYRLRLGSTILARFLEANGFAGGAREKRVPQWVYGLPLSQKLAFLGGFVDSDGYVRDHPKNHDISLTSANRDLLQDVAQLLSLCGLPSSEIHRFEGKHPIDKERTMVGYRMTVSGDYQRIMSRHPRRLERMDNRKYHHDYSSAKGTNFAKHVTEFHGYVKIDSITPAGTEMVYDIEVEGPHNFVAEGLIVHNSEVIYHKVREDLEKQGVIFVDPDTAFREYEDIFRPYFATVIPPNDNKFAALNSAVFSGGSFIYVPKGVKIDLPLQAYFRINAQNMGQFERTLIIADEGSYVHYVEGCFLAGARVRTREGEKLIEDIQEGDEVLTHKGRYRRVYHTMQRPYHGNIYHITVVGDMERTLHVTEEHPLLVVRPNGIKQDGKPVLEWIFASQVTTGDYLVTPSPKIAQMQVPIQQVWVADDRYLYLPVRSIEIEEMETTVYNFSVEEDESYVGEGVISHNCTAPTYTTDSLHSAVVEIIVRPRARVRYTTIQNWSKNVYNLVTKRAQAYADATMEWVDGNLGCLAEGSTVTTPEGVKPIEALEIGDKVLSYDESKGELCFQTVKAKRFSGFQPVHTVSFGERKLQVTANHPFYSYKYDAEAPKKLGRYQLGYVRADQLKEAIIPRTSIDYGSPYQLQAPNLVTEFTSANQYASDLKMSRGLGSRLSGVEFTNDDIMWLFGYWTGDGNIEVKAGQNEGVIRWAKVGFSTPTTDRARERLVQTMTALVDAIPTERADGHHLFWSSKELAELFHANGFIGNARTKRVPKWVWSLPESQRIAFIAGYLDADGTVNTGRFALKSANRELLEDIASLLVTLGITPRLYTDFAEPREVEIMGVTCTAHSSYRLVFRGDPRFFTHVSAVLRGQAESNASTTVRDRHVGRSQIELPQSVEIVDVDVSEAASEPVPTWDIEVEGTGNFVANGFIVHNSKLTMKYPAVWLMEPGAKGEVLSVAFASDGQHQDTGAKMVHVAPHTSSNIVSKSISKGSGRASYRGLLKVQKGADHVKSNVRCDALLIDENSRTDTYPYMEIEEEDVEVGHEASVSKVGEEQLFYLMSRGISENEAYTMVVRGFIEPIVKELPMEYAVELNRLIQLEMSGSVG